MCTRSTFLRELKIGVMVIILIMFMFVVATLAAILDMQISFAIETSPLLLFGGENMRARPHESTFLCELKTKLWLFQNLPCPWWPHICMLCKSPDIQNLEASP